jgi:hypothetical protein
MGLVSLTVWIDDWQMQCCGEPFQVGSVVTWILDPKPEAGYLTAVLGEDEASRVTHYENHHGPVLEEFPSTVGTVTAIRAVSCRFAPRPGDDSRMNYPVPGTSRISERTSADGWDVGPSPDGADEAGSRFIGYVVDIVPVP